MKSLVPTHDVCTQCTALYLRPLASLLESCTPSLQSPPGTPNLLQTLDFNLDEDFANDEGLNSLFEGEEQDVESSGQ
jgi:hypothetical protein